MSWVFFKWDTHSAVSLPRPVDDITPWWHHKSETSFLWRCHCVFHVTKLDFYASLDAPRRSDASSTYGAAILEDTYVAVAEKHACCQSNTRRGEGWVRVCFLSHLSVNEPRRGKQTVVSVSRWRRERLRVFVRPEFRLSGRTSSQAANTPEEVSTNNWAGCKPLVKLQNYIIYP